MPLPTPNLDDLRFQRDLVDEARRRIIRYCPEWTDYNVSDPGITLIELFAWMTEQMLYRLNRVPDKNYIKFLELLGIRLHPASSARAELTFWLSAPFPLAPEDDTTATVAQGIEVATWPTEEEEEIVFTTDERLIIAPPRLTQVRREDEFNRNYLSRLGIQDFYTFNRRRPQEGDTFYLGFDPDQDMSGYILQLAFTCRPTEATGIRREDPPLVWECSLGGGNWYEISLSQHRGEKDTTGGLNNEQGRLVLYLPLSIKTDRVHDRTAYWIRCRFEQRHPGQGRYTESPRIRGIQAYALGATTWATHAQNVYEEVLGHSDGEPGQVFYLQNVPVLSFQNGETIEIEEVREGESAFIPWKRVNDFSQSKIHDRHFTLDEATGEINFGPCIRQPDGTMKHYGRVPEARRAIRVSQYRHGGGVRGNVPINKLQVLRSAIPYIDRVTNLRPASGGQDQESLEEAKLRAQREIRAQSRAVTSADYESFAKAASRRVARARSNAAGEVAAEGANGRPSPGTVELLIVPAVSDSLKMGDLSRLTVDQGLRTTVRRHLDQYRLLTTRLQIREPRYLGIRVYVKIVVSEYHQPETVVSRVRELLQLFITPLAIDSEDEELTAILDPDWEGWPFGQDLYVAEIYSRIQQIPGVKHVLEVLLGQRPVVPSKESPPQNLLSADERSARQEEEASFAEEEEEEEEQEETVPLSDQRTIQVPMDTLICLLDSDVEVVSL